MVTCLGFAVQESITSAVSAGGTIGPSKMAPTCKALVLILLAQSTHAQTVASDVANVHWVRQEVEIAGVLDDLSHHAGRGPTAFKDVAVVDPRTGAAIAGQTVVVREGRVAWAGAAADAPDLTAATVIDGHGLYLSPGLVDMHVHTL